MLAQMEERVCVEEVRRVFIGVGKIPRKKEEGMNRVLAISAIAAVASAHSAATPAKWHQARRAAILKAHPEVKDLIGRSSSTLPLLAVTNGLQVASCVAASHLPTPALVPLAILGGGTLSLWQFALLHDIKHGTAELPNGVKANDVVFWGSLPSLFGYYLYLRFGHLSHHRDFGSRPLKELFDSEQETFEDGDALFVAHRQNMPGDPALGSGERVGFVGAEDVGGLGVSISRTIYSLLWLDGAAGGTASAASGRESEALRSLRSAYNALVFSFSMTFERAALVGGGSLAVGLTGRNFFFPRKPQAFHDTAAAYARVSIAVVCAILALAGPGAIAWLFWAEVGWQLPIHPASAMFVSNHPSLDAAPEGETASVGGCQPTSSVYIGEWYDWLCCFSNFHVEHHDFPDVPAFRLRELRDIAPSFYSDRELSGARDGWWETMRRTFERRDFYACSGVGPSGSGSLAE